MHNLTIKSIWIDVVSFGFYDFKINVVLIKSNDIFFKRMQRNLR